MNQELKIFSTDDLKQKYFFHILPDFTKETPLVISSNKNFGQKYFQAEFNAELKKTSATVPFTSEVLLFPGKIHHQLNQLFNPSGKNDIKSSIILKKSVTVSELDCLLTSKGEMPKVQMEKLKELLAPQNYPKRKPKTWFKKIIQRLFKK